MEKESARSQTLEQLHERRKQVIRLHKRGIKVMQLVQMTGLSYSAVRKVLDLYSQGGWAAIKPAARGRKRGDARLLTPEQEAHIQKTICDKRPEQLKMDFFLWSRAAVMHLIEQEYGLKLGVRTVDKNLARWGFTPQKPIKKAYEQRPEAVKAWLADRTHQIEVFYLPSYSPELNPEERLNADLKQAMGKRVPVRTKAKLRDAANEHMAMLEKSPERVMRYFQDPRVKYAAD
jgi:transposase